VRLFSLPVAASVTKEGLAVSGPCQTATDQRRAEIQRAISERNGKRRALFDAQDEIDWKREVLIASIQGKLEQKVNFERLFFLRWRLA